MLQEHDDLNTNRTHPSSINLNLELYNSHLQVIFEANITDNENPSLFEASYLNCFDYICRKISLKEKPFLAYRCQLLDQEM